MSRLRFVNLLQRVHTTQNTNFEPSRRVILPIRLQRQVQRQTQLVVTATLRMFCLLS